MPSVNLFRRSPLSKINENGSRAAAGSLSDSRHEMHEDLEVEAILNEAKEVYDGAKYLLEIIKRRAIVERSCYSFKVKTLQRFYKQSSNSQPGVVVNKILSSNHSPHCDSSEISDNAKAKNFEANWVPSVSKTKTELEIAKRKYLAYISAVAMQHENLAAYILDKVVPRLEYAIKKLYDVKKEVYAYVIEQKKAQKDIENGTKKVIKDLDILRFQKHNFDSQYDRYIISSAKPKDVELVENKLKALDQRIDSYHDLSFILRGLYTDFNRMKYAVIYPKICMTLHEYINETINTFVSIMEASIFRELEGIETLRLHIKGLSGYFEKKSSKVDGNKPSIFSPLTLKDSGSYSFLSENSHCFITDENDQDEIFRLPLLYRREDIVTDWLRLSFSFNKKPCVLYAYDHSEFHTVKKNVILTVDLCVFVIVDIDSTYTGFPHSFQLINLKGNMKQVNTFCATSAAQKGKWMLTLEDFAHCCFKSITPHDILSGDVTAKSYYQIFLTETLAPYGQLKTSNKLANKKQKSSSLSIYRSIKLTFHDLKLSNKKIPASNTANKYCSIFVGEDKHAEAGGTMSGPFFCEDSFEFKDICPHVKFISIVLLERRSFNSSMPLGYTTIQLPNRPSTIEHSSVVQLKPIKPAQSIQVIHGEDKYYLRISYLYKAVYILPITYYNQLLNMLVSDDYELIKAVDTVINPQGRSRFASAFLDVLMHLDNVLDCLKSLIRFDIEKTMFLNTVFRSNTILTKILDQYFKVLGKNYLGYIIGEFLEDNFRCKNATGPDNTLNTGTDFEVLPTSSETIKYAQILWNRILENKAVFPVQLRLVLSCLVKIVESKWPNEGGKDTTSRLAKYFAINSFVFLRFMCPAIMSPHLFGMVIRRCDKNEMSQLKTLAKIIQSLANVGSFSNKSRHSDENLESFVCENTRSMMGFMDYISQVTSDDYNMPAMSDAAKCLLPRDTRYSIECIVSTLSELKLSMKGILKPEKYNDMSRILEIIDEEKRILGGAVLGVSPT